ncbi:iron-siderophore ABC transporter substrate-binding protein [Actinomyces vulturis]|uniref:iron-siderophore ABC transporter substrate-binding protein n=1 Tax=Actinomyces vulturis TaxID=1857645 RepID=UPI00082CEBA3|nr:iron-siderophore ABC transporter substrate-binding protein [Actinomyces vulturis]
MSSLKRHSLSRRSLMALSATAVAATLAACSSSSSEKTSSASGDDYYPVTIAHALGTTTIDKEPTRVVTISWMNADVVVSLGVIPVGVPEEMFGANENKSTPWRDEALTKLNAGPGTAAYPTQFSEADGLPIQDIAALKPDLIVGAYSGLTQEDYDKLAAIAPTLAYPEQPWATSWQDATTMTAKALNKVAEGEQVISNVTAAFDQAKANNPQFEGATFIAANIDPADHSISLYTDIDNRPKFLSSLGMTMAPVVEQAVKDAGADATFFVSYSPENADKLESDVFMTWVNSEEDKAVITSDPLFSKIPAVANGTAIMDADATRVLSISASSPLSLPWALEQYTPMLAHAIDAKK